MHLTSQPDLVMRTVTLDIAYLSTPPGELARYLGGDGKQSKAWDAVSESATRLEERIAPSLAARARLAAVPVEIKGSRELILNETLAFPCASRYFRGATMAAMAIVTVGDQAERERTRLFEDGEYLDAIVVDALASAALARAMRDIRQELNRRLAPTQLGYTLSPGCRQIPLEAQKVIFQLLQPEVIGIRLTESFLMVPLKTSSAMIPVGPGLAYPSERGDACHICAIGKTCTYRATPRG